jgi:hypothetical protein
MDLGRPDIEAWLRDQWAGLFREMLHRRSSQQQLATLSAQVDFLKEVNETLKRYLETIVKKVSPEKAAELIEGEEQRLRNASNVELAVNNRFYKFLMRYLNLDHPGELLSFLLEMDSVDDLLEYVREHQVGPTVETQVEDLPTSIFCSYL